MIHLDGGPLSGGGSFLRTALTLSAIFQKPITLTNISLEKTFQGLSADKIAFIHALATATDAVFSGVEPGSTSITFLPSHPWSQKKVSLGLQGSISLAVQGLILPALFSRQKVSLTFTGRTHGKKAPSTTYVKNVFFRYLNSLVDELTLKENSFGFSASGDVEIVVWGRINRLPPLNVSGGETLAGIRLEFAASKDYLSEEILRHLEDIAQLTIPQVRVSTRYVESEKSGIAAGIFAFYGNEYGFDNDKPFIIGKDVIWEGKLERDALEKKCGEFLKKFRDSLVEPAIDEFCADQLIVLLAIVGGSIKVREVTGKVKANIAAAELISGTTFIIRDNVIEATPHLDGL